MERFLVVLRSYKSGLPPELIDYLRQHVLPVRLKKGEIIRTKEPHIDCDYFVEKGLIQQVLETKKGRNIYRFKMEDQWILCRRELFERGVGHFDIEALEDTLLWSFPMSMMDEPSDKNVIFYRHMTTIMMLDLEIAHYSGDCRIREGNPENYYQFCKHFPQLLQRVPFANLANFLWLSEPVLRHLHEKTSMPRL